MVSVVLGSFAAGALSGSEGTLVGPGGAQAAPICSSLVHCATLTIDVGGRGTGAVVSTPAGIECTVTAGVESGDCTETYTWPRSQGTQLVIAVERRATPSSLWCSPDNTCWERSTISGAYLRAGDDITYGGSFVLKRLTLSVTRSGAGTGRVTSSPGGIACGADCAESFEHGTSVTLTAVPDGGAVFRAWTGACAGKGPVCTLQLTETAATNAVFELPSTTPPPPPPPPPTTPPPAPPPPPTNRFVDADIGAAAAARTRLGARVARIELDADEPLAATFELRRAAKTLVSKRYPRLDPGERLLTIFVPRKLSAGPATVRLVLTDQAGNSKGARRQIAIGALR
jgi:hypothetical protein